MKMNWFDRFVGFFSANQAMRRSQMRAVTEVLERNFEGASRGRRTKNWRAPPTDAEAASFGTLSFLRDRSRDLVRNNPYAAKAMQVLESNTIGTGIIAKVIGDKASGLWEDWSKSSDCDRDGALNFCGLQSLAFNTMVQSGEVLVRRIRTPSSDGRAVPLQLQILEPDYIDETKESVFGTMPRTIRGIEYDLNGKRTAYWLWKQHPGTRIRTEFFADGLTSHRVPAEEIIHLYRKDRPGQERGVPWFAPIIMRLRDFDEYEDAQLIRQKISSCFVGFLKDTEQPIDPTSCDNNPISEKFEPGLIEVLPPGKDITFANPPSVGSDFSAYANYMLHAIAAGLGIPYEGLTGDYSMVNFSSGRMGWIEFHRNLEKWRWNCFIPVFCEGVREWFMEAAEVSAGLQRNRAKSWDWTPPRREMIDPVKEIEGMKMAVRSGFKTLSETLRELGYDPTQVFKEYRDDNKSLDDLKLVLDSDPRKTNANGQAVISTGGGASAEPKS